MQDDLEPHLYHFEFDPNIHAELIAKFQESPTLSLVKGVGPQLKGVYGLYWHEELVYVGKAISMFLRGRLNEHRRKIEGRKNIEITDVQCRFLVISSDWLIWAAEDTLIKLLTPPWNTSGFGRHVQGVNRKDGANWWDTEFPHRGT